MVVNERVEKYALLVLGLFLWVYVPFYLVSNLEIYAWDNAKIYYISQGIPLLVVILMTRDPANIGGFAAGISAFLFLFSALLKSFHSSDAAMGWILHPYCLLIGMIAPAAVIPGVRDKRPIARFLLVGAGALAGFLVLPLLLWNVQFFKLFS